MLQQQERKIDKIIKTFPDQISKHGKLRHIAHPTGPGGPGTPRRSDVRQPEVHDRARPKPQGRAKHAMKRRAPDANRQRAHQSPHEQNRRERAARCSTPRPNTHLLVRTCTPAADARASRSTMRTHMHSTQHSRLHPLIVSYSTPHVYARHSINTHIHKPCSVHTLPYSSPHCAVHTRGETSQTRDACTLIRHHAQKSLAHCCLESLCVLP